MKIKDLKVGDVIYIREDLEHGAWYGSYMYINAMGSGIKQIQYIQRDGGFSVVCGKGARYTSEMVDWEKTRRLKLNESWENIKKAIRGDGIFKEITQFGESGNEITKAIGCDGKEIIVKNNNEKNDVEKAVMLLMLKQHGFTYSDVKKEVEKVKVKWIPSIGEQFYYVSTTPTLKARALTYFTEGALKEMIDTGKEMIDTGNYFKTREEAERKAEEIKEVLKGE